MIKMLISIGFSPSFFFFFTVIIFQTSIDEFSFIYLSEHCGLVSTQLCGSDVSDTMELFTPADGLFCCRRIGFYVNRRVIFFKKSRSLNPAFLSGLGFWAGTFFILRPRPLDINPPLRRFYAAWLFRSSAGPVLKHHHFKMVFLISGNTPAPITR